MMLTSGLILAIIHGIRTEINKKVPESLKTKPVDNKLKRLLFCIQNHIQLRCVKMERKIKRVKVSRKP